MKTISILGCGDFLRWQFPDLKKSRQVAVRYLYDPETARAAKYAAELGGEVASSPDQVFADHRTDIVALFVPPWVRRGLFESAVAARKAVITTKPLAPSIGDVQAMEALCRTKGVIAGVIYNRTDDPAVEALKALFEAGTYGKLALFRQDWIHGYPKWNRWATDPAKNGGPFMDAMIHNLNIARYLMGRKLERAQWVSRNLAHPDLPCADTEAVTAFFEDNGLASLFITWAADLATYSLAGNDREHIDLFYLVTDHGWRLTKELQDGKHVIAASREGKRETRPVPPHAETAFDLFAQALDRGDPLPKRLVSIEEAARDITLICEMRNAGPISLWPA